MTAGAILDFVLNLILIPKFGAAGAAFSTTMAEILVLVVQCIYLRSQIWGMIKDIQIWKIVIGVIGATVGGVIFDKVTTLGVFLTLCISVILFLEYMGEFCLY